MSGWAIGTTGYCTMFDGVGNSNPVWGTMGTVSPERHVSYSCSSSSTYIDTATFAIALLEPNILSGAGCAIDSQPQSFGEYRNQFIDVRNNADQTLSVIGDDDDTDIGR